MVSTTPAPQPCAVRDPDDGACYPSADAADLAWLARTSLITFEGVPVAVLSASAFDDDESEGLDEDAEDGGVLAPVDARQASPPPASAASTSAIVAAASAKPSFWRSLARTVTGLVVRKADSHPVSIPEEELAALFAADFPLPVELYPVEKLHDSFYAPRGSHRRHHAIDLPAPRGTPVVAVVAGVIERLGRDRAGGKVCYLRDVTGRFTFYYAHLAEQEKGLRVGDKVKKGQRLGRVGATGHVIGGPHLHFAIFREAEEAKMPAPRALAVNPYLIFSAVVSR